MRRGLISALVLISLTVVGVGLCKESSKTIGVTVTQPLTEGENGCDKALALALLQALQDELRTQLKMEDQFKVMNLNDMKSRLFRGFIKNRQILEPCNDLSLPPAIKIKATITDEPQVDDLAQVLIKNKVLLVSVELIGDHPTAPSILLGYLTPWFTKHGQTLTAITSDLSDKELLAIKDRAVSGDPYAAMFLGLQAQASKVIFGIGKAKQQQLVTANMVAAALDLTLYALDVSSGKIIATYNSTGRPTIGYGPDLKEAAFTAFKKGIEALASEFLPDLKP